MGMNAIQIESARNTLAGYEGAARLAATEGNMERHMDYGRKYHLMADKLTEETGTDPRPTEEPTSKPVSPRLEARFRALGL
jgi:hypothetical protein